MPQKNRTQLKDYFKTNDKPTQAQFIDLIDSMFTLLEDGGAAIKTMLHGLLPANRLTKSAVRGADFALNFRGVGDLYSSSFKTSGMQDILKGDYWVKNNGNSPAESDNSDLIEGDWVVAMVDGASYTNYAATNNWQILRFRNRKLGSSINNTQFDETGHQTMIGDAQPWEDLRVEPIARTTGTNAPAFEKWFDSGGLTRGVFLYSFDDAVVGSQKEVFFNIQMPHAWNGGTISIHVHWVPYASETAKDVIWGLEYNFKKISEVFGSTATVYTSGTIVPDDANLVAGKHYISEFADITPGNDANGISSILIGRLFRYSSSGSDTYTNKVGLLFVDAHYQLNSLGSTLEYTK